MPKHIVKCKYCGKQFDTNEEPYVMVSARRYAHKSCAEEYEKSLSQEEKDFKKLEQYVMKLFDEPFLNARIKKQIKDYKKEYGYTYSGMLKALIWFYEIKGNSIEKANGGIGIVPYIYKDAYNYFFALHLAQLSNEEKDINQLKPKIKKITITPPRISKKPLRLFDFDKIENGENIDE